MHSEEAAVRGVEYRNIRYRLRLLLAVGVLTAAIGAVPAIAQLRGHGGPVRALAISSDGQTLLSGSFDGSAIRWSLGRDAAEQVLRFHADAVNAIALLKDNRVATAGADGRIAIWSPGKQQPDTVLEGHTAPIAALALSPGWRNPRLSSMGPYCAALAARRRHGARAGRSYTEREWCRVQPRWQISRQCQL